MDPATLATTVTTFLVPYLTKFGENLAEDTGKKLWEAITSKLKEKPAGAGTASEFAEDAEDSDNQEAFAIQLKKALKDDPDFAKMVADLVNQAKSEGISNIGSGSVATSRDINVGNLQDINGPVTIGTGNSISQTTNNNQGKTNRSKKKQNE